MAIPKLAQSKINSAKFHIDGITITKTRTKTMTVALNASMGVTGTAGLKATIAQFPAELYLADLEPYTTFLALDFPKTSASSHINLNITQDIEIQNMEAFTTFAAWLLGKETLNLGMRGKTSIRVRGISRNYGISFKKSIELKGKSSSRRSVTALSKVNPYRRQSIQGLGCHRYFNFSAA